MFLIKLKFYKLVTVRSLVFYRFFFIKGASKDFDVELDLLERPLN